MLETSPFLFYALSVVIIASAIIVVRARNIFHAALSLGITFLGVAGIFLTLRAEFIAGAQILIYVGAIIVLILFAIMLTHNIQSKDKDAFNKIQPLSLIATCFIAFFFGLIILHQNLPIMINPNIKIESNTLEIGKALMKDYILPFELVSVLLLAALIGAIIIAKKEKPDDRN